MMEALESHHWVSSDQPSDWSPFPFEGNNNILEDPLSDSDSSLDSASYPVLYFNDVSSSADVAHFDSRIPVQHDPIQWPIDEFPSNTIVSKSIENNSMDTINVEAYATVASPDSQSTTEDLVTSPCSSSSPHEYSYMLNYNEYSYTGDSSDGDSPIEDDSNLESEEDSLSAFGHQNYNDTSYQNGYNTQKDDLMEKYEVEDDFDQNEHSASNPSGDASHQYKNVCDQYGNVSVHSGSDLNQRKSSRNCSSKNDSNSTLNQPDTLKQVQEMIRVVNSAVTGTNIKKSSKRSTESSISSSSSNPKKRSRVEPVESNSVILSRNQLLTMTSEELDELVARIKADHPLTPQEIREVKRQRRLIKNREYAQASRVKKKSALSDLGTKFAELEEEKNKLAQRVVQLEKENAMLRSQLGLSTLSTSSNQSNQSNQSSQSSSNSFSSNSISNSYDITIDAPPKPKRARNSKTLVNGATTALFAMIFFAVVFFSSNSPFVNQIFYGHHPSQTAPAIINNVPNTIFDNNFDTFRKMKMLSIDENQISTAAIQNHFSSPGDTKSSPATSAYVLTMEDVGLSEQVVNSLSRFVQQNCTQNQQFQSINPIVGSC